MLTGQLIHMAAILVLAMVSAARDHYCYEAIMQCVVLLVAVRFLSQLMMCSRPWYGRWSHDRWYFTRKPRLGGKKTSSGIT